MVKIKIIIGSTRQKRFSEHPARWVFEELKNRPEIDAELLDLRDYPLPFYEEPQTPKQFNGSYPNPVVARWAEKIREAQAFIIVTPEYNHGYPAVLKNALDNVYVEWNKKPVFFISYGSVEGARAVEQLRQVVVELKMIPIRDAVHIQKFPTLLDENGNIKPGAFDPLKPMLDTCISDLLWFAERLK